MFIDRYRKILIFTLIAFTLLCCAFFAINSGMFVKYVAFPVASRALGIEIEVKDVDFSLFRGFDLTDIRAGGRNDPLFIASRFRVSYNALAFFRGKISIDEIHLQGAELRLVEGADGRLNLPVRKNEASSATESRTKSFSNFEIGAITIEDLTVSFHRNPGNISDEIAVTVSDVNMSVSNISPGNPFEVKSTAALKVVRAGRENIEAKKIKLSLVGALGRDLLPDALDLSMDIAGFTGNSGVVGLAGREINMKVKSERDGDTFRIPVCTLSESNLGSIEGLLALEGEFSLTTSSAALRLQVDINNPDFINAIGGLIGDYSFGKTTLKYSGELLSTDNFSRTELAGDLMIKDLTILSRRAELRDLSPVDIRFNHALSFETGLKKVGVQTLKLLVTADSQDRVTLTLTNPIEVSFAGANVKVDSPAEIHVRISDFELGVFQSLIPEDLSSCISNGVTNGEALLRLAQDRETFTLAAEVGVSNLSYPTLSLDDINVNFKAATIGNLRGSIDIQRVDLEVLSGKDLMASGNVRGEFDTNDLMGKFDVKVADIGAPLLDLAARLANSDFKFDNTSYTYEGTVEVGPRAKEISFEGVSTFDNFVTTSSTVPTPALKPLKIVLSQVGSYDVELGHLRLDTVSVNIDDPDTRIVKINLERPLTLRFDAGSGSEGALHSPATIKLEVDGMQLEPFRAMVPSNYGLEFPTGIFGCDLKIDISDSAQQLACNGGIQFSQMNFSGLNQTGPSEDGPIDIDIAVGIRYSNDGMLTSKDTRISLNSADTTVFRATIDGQIDIALTGTPTEVSFATVGPVDAKRLHLIFTEMTGKPTNVSTEQTSAGEKVANALTEPDLESGSLNLTAHISVPELNYDDITIKEARFTARLRDSAAVVEPFSFRLNEGTVTGEGGYDYRDSKQPSYRGKLGAQGVIIEPIIAGVLPNYQSFASGTLDKLETTFSGKGLTMPMLTENLQVTATTSFSDINGANIAGKYRQILKLLGILETDLIFETTSFSGAVTNGFVEIAELGLSNSGLLLTSNGRVEFGGKWLPDLNFRLGYAGRMKDLAKKNKIKLVTEEDGYHFTETLPLKIDSWEPSVFLKEWIPSISSKLFDLTLDEQGVILGAKGIESILSGDKDAFRNVIRDGVRLFGSKNQKERKSTEEKEGQEDVEKEDAPVKSELDGLLNIFGR